METTVNVTLMDEEKKTRPYELAYLLKAALSEESILNWKEKINRLVQDFDGKVNEHIEPQKNKLAYPIKKAGQGLLGIIKFEMVTEKIKELDRKLKLEGGELLRFLILVDEEREKPAVTKPARVRRPTEIEKPPEVKLEEKGPPREEKPPKPKEEELPKPKEEKKIELEELDKKLEEILGG